MGLPFELQGKRVYLFYPKTSGEAIRFLSDYRERIDHFEFRLGTMDDAFMALTRREVC